MNWWVAVSCLDMPPTARPRAWRAAACGASQEGRSALRAMATDLVQEGYSSVDDAFRRQFSVTVDVEMFLVKLMSVWEAEHEQVRMPLLLLLLLLALLVAAPVERCDQRVPCVVSVQVCAMLDDGEEAVLREEEVMYKKRIKALFKRHLAPFMEEVRDDRMTEATVKEGMKVATRNAMAEARDVVRARNMNELLIDRFR